MRTLLFFLLAGTLGMGQEAKPICKEGATATDWSCVTVIGLKPYPSDCLQSGHWVCDDDGHYPPIQLCSVWAAHPWSPAPDQCIGGGSPVTAIMDELFVQARRKPEKVLPDCYQQQKSGAYLPCVEYECPDPHKQILLPPTQDGSVHVCLRVTP